MEQSARRLWFHQIFGKEKRKRLWLLSNEICRFLLRLDRLKRPLTLQTLRLLHFDSFRLWTASFFWDGFSKGSWTSPKGLGLCTASAVRNQSRAVLEPTTYSLNIVHNHPGRGCIGNEFVAKWLGLALLTIQTETLFTSDAAKRESVLLGKWPEFCPKFFKVKLFSPICIIISGHIFSTAALSTSKPTFEEPTKRRCGYFQNDH